MAIWLLPWLNSHQQAHGALTRHTIMLVMLTRAKSAGPPALPRGGNMMLEPLHITCIM